MEYVIPVQAPPSLAVEGAQGRFPVPRIYGVGRNYAEHAREMGPDPDREPPFFFMKPADTIVTDGRDFVYPLLYPSFALGAHGAIAAILTAVPQLCVQLWDAVQGGDHEQALALHEKPLPIWNAIFHDNLPANVKHGLALEGRPAGSCGRRCPRRPSGRPNPSGTP